MTACLVWFRDDLRLADNPALAAAVASGAPIVPVFIWAPGEEGDWPPGAASRWWLHHSLRALEAHLRGAGSRLVLRRVDAAGADGASTSTLAALLALAHEVGAATVFWNRRYEPAIVARDTALKQSLKEAGMAVPTYNARLLYEPWALRTQAGQPFRVFSHFWRALLAAEPPAHPLPAPERLTAPPSWPEGDALDDLDLLPGLDWTAGLRARWQPGERSGALRLARFVTSALSAYAGTRDAPAAAGTSCLSPHLHFGELGPRQIWWAVRDASAAGGDIGQAGVDSYLRELAWREFAHHVLYHFPHTPLEPMQPAFARFPWLDVPAHRRAWQRGETGYPFVDAGMRELWRTGFMHNRVRMVAASFLVKHLLQPWQAGERWFWDTLVDADLAQNALGWQWVAGSGADAAPYFRVFNPVLQGQKFDPDGAYTRAWVPELAAVPDKYLHAPWLCPENDLRRAGVTLGINYPLPIIDPAEGRQRALAAYETL